MKGVSPNSQLLTFNSKGKKKVRYGPRPGVADETPWELGLNLTFDYFRDRDNQVPAGAGDHLLLDPSSLKNREWMTTEQAASYLALSVGALRNMTSNGQVPYCKLGKRNRYNVVELRQLLLSQKRGGCNGN